MKVLLLNSSFLYRTPWLIVTEPLGILYLAAYLRKYSAHKVSVLDCVSNKRVKKIGPRQYWYGLDTKEMLEAIELLKPDIIGITCMFSRKKDDFLRCASLIKKKFPQIILVGGGIYPSLFPGDLAVNKQFDYFIAGEGEQSFLNLVNTLSDNSQAKENIEGLAFLRDGKVIVNPKKTYIENLDTIPHPARDLIDYEGYAARKIALGGLGLKRSASLLTSRSCPNRCNFCSMFMVHGPKWRGRTAQDVISEIAELKERYKIKDLFIMDDNFTFNKQRVMEICEGILRAGLKIRWNTPNGISIATLDRELLSVMKASGCRSISIAIESGDEELRNKVIGKRLSDAAIFKAAQEASRLGIFINAYYIIGMPGETEEKFQRTLRQVRELPFNAVDFSFANPLPGTKLYQDCIANNWKMLEHDPKNEDTLYRPYIVTADFTENDLALREKRFYRTFYLAKFFTIIKDALLLRNKLLYPRFIMRILSSKIFRG